MDHHLDNHPFGNPEPLEPFLGPLVPFGPIGALLEGLRLEGTLFTWQIVVLPHPELRPILVYSQQ